MRQLALFKEVIVFLFVLWPAAQAQYRPHGVGSALVGGCGFILAHETGHALTALAVGFELQAFRPYPNRNSWQMPDGSIEKRWSLGTVAISPGQGSDRQKALVAAMGSGGNSLAVLLLAPLLPHVRGFGAQALDDFLLFGTFDWPAYALAGTLGYGSGTGDWSQVVQFTGVPIWVWLSAGVAESLLLNQYRLYWRQRAGESGGLTTDAPMAATRIGFSF